MMLWGAYAIPSNFQVIFSVLEAATTLSLDSHSIFLVHEPSTWKENKSGHSDEL